MNMAVKITSGEAAKRSRMLKTAMKSLKENKYSDLRKGLGKISPINAAKQFLRKVEEQKIENKRKKK